MVMPGEEPHGKRIRITLFLLKEDHIAWENGFMLAKYARLSPQQKKEGVMPGWYHYNKTYTTLSLSSKGMVMFVKMVS